MVRIARICEEYVVTIYMAILAKRIVLDKWVMSSPNSMAGKALSEDTVKLVISDSGFPALELGLDMYTIVLANLVM